MGRKALVLLLLLVPLPLSGQPRSLYWKSLSVEARLDGEGKLHVSERHHMVFTGDWNGGERGFRLAPDHELELQSIEREDLETHSRLPLTENGDLSRVDDYAFTDSTTLRWRSRLPSDPPFQDTELVYVIDYTLENVLVPTEEGYLLDHDFAFPERPGAILTFSLDISLDEAWRATTAFAEHVTRDDLPPGQSVVVTVPVIYLREGYPGAVLRGVPAPSRTVLALLVATAAAVIGFLFYRGEDALGRFASLTPVSSIDEAWLEANVFTMLPEEVGAAWDNRTAAPEVAAILARMVAEGKLETEVYQTKGFLSSSQNLRMELLVDRDSLKGYEGILIRSLFVSGKVTDTEKIRKHYEDRGFDPASKISEPLKRRVSQILGNANAPRPISRKPALYLLLASLAVLALAALFDTKGFLAILPRLSGAGLYYGIGFLAAAFYRKRVEKLFSYSLTFLIPAGLLAAIGIWFVGFAPYRNGFLALLGLALFVLALLTSLFNAAKFREGSLALDLRRTLASARRYFTHELSKSHPALDDKWFPYLIGFGLGGDVDRWFHAYGPASASGSTSSSTDHGSGSSTTGGGRASQPWTGGGGAFGGAGATGTWVAAASAVAAGVSAPSESSSGGSGGGGGGGGGGSSGGGSGGGW
jgi:uncharacterized membrane protein YgcG